MEKRVPAEDWPYTASAADLIAGQRPQERTLIDFCRSPFSFGLLLVVPIAIVVVVFVVILRMKPALLQMFTGAEPASVVNVFGR
jgi:hypothetical protein